MTFTHSKSVIFRIWPELSPRPLGGPQDNLASIKIGEWLFDPTINHSFNKTLSDPSFPQVCFCLFAQLLVLKKLSPPQQIHHRQSSAAVSILSLFSCFQFFPNKSQLPLSNISGRSHFATNIRKKNVNKHSGSSNCNIKIKTNQKFCQLDRQLDISKKYNRQRGQRST